MNASYVVFLTIAATIVLLLCVNYVRLQSELTQRSKRVTALQEELADLKEENTTKYGEFVTSYFAWLTLEKQKENAKKMDDMTKKKGDEHGL